MQTPSSLLPTPPLRTGLFPEFIISCSAPSLWNVFTHTLLGSCHPGPTFSLGLTSSCYSTYTSLSHSYLRKVNKRAIFSTGFKYFHNISSWIIATFTAVPRPRHPLGWENWQCSTMGAGPPVAICRLGPYQPITPWHFWRSEVMHVCFKPPTSNGWC